MQKSTLIGVGTGLAALAAIYYTVGRPWLAKMRGQAASMRSVASAAKASAPRTPVVTTTSKGAQVINRAADPVKEIKAQAGRGEFDPTGLDLGGFYG